ncbi:hypothetical protein CMI47_17740 [Candidatus Pacearchaeota archaeon]|jgi:hypothetical protein|nr:hypothetical protein [Candidatus Pacearchaeota archaeon]
MNLKYKYAIGCLVQWYEVEILGEYIESVNNALDQIDNKENVMVDFHVNMNQDLEKCDEVYSLKEIEEKLKKLLENDNFSVIFTYDKIYTIADYRRDFNNKYCTEVDVLMWGETDSLIPRQTFMILDGLHHQTKDKTPKYVATFGICKMWDDSWKPIEHSEFTDKPFIENDYDNWWSLKYTMNINEMNKFNDKVTELNVQVLNSFKFNGCGLVFSSELVRCGANIPRSVFFVHEDTSFMLSVQRMFGDTIPQFIVKNILIVHNRNHPKKRMYVKGETGQTMNLKRRSNDWYVKASKMSEENCYNSFNQIKSYSWKDVFND